MKWNFLAPRTYKVEVNAPLAAVKSALKRHFNNPDIKYGSYRFGVASSSYKINGPNFSVEQWQAMKRSTVLIRVEGTIYQTGKISTITLHCVIKSELGRMLLWAVTIFGIVTFGNHLLKLNWSDVDKRDFLSLPFNLMFVIIPQLMKLEYLDARDNVHRQLLAALKPLY